MFRWGANIIDSIKCEKRIGNDLSSPLIALWKGLQQGREVKLYTRDEYNYIKNHKEEFDDFTLGVVGFLHSYNAKYFGGYAGGITTKTGVNRDYRVESINNIMKQREGIQDVMFVNKDYKEMKDIKGAVIYADIPYKSTTGYEVCFNHDEFYDWAREKSKDNIVLISELQAPEDFVCIWEQVVTRTHNHKDRFKSVEKLFVHKTNLEKI